MNHPSEGICTNSHKWRRNGSNNAWGSLTYSIRPALPLRCLYLGVHSTSWNQSICETPMSSRILTYARRGPKFRILGWTSNTSCKTVSSIPCLLVISSYPHYILNPYKVVSIKLLVLSLVWSHVFWLYQAISSLHPQSSNQQPLFPHSQNGILVLNKYLKKIIEPSG